MKRDERRFRVEGRGVQRLRLQSLESYAKLPVFDFLVLRASERLAPIPGLQIVPCHGYPIGGQIEVRPHEAIPQSKPMRWRNRRPIVLQVQCVRGRKERLPCLFPRLGYHHVGKDVVRQFPSGLNKRKRMLVGQRRKRKDGHVVRCQTIVFRFVPDGQFAIGTDVIWLFPIVRHHVQFGRVQSLVLDVFGNRHQVGFPFDPLVSNPNEEPHLRPLSSKCSKPCRQEATFLPPKPCPFFPTFPSSSTLVWCLKWGATRSFAFAWRCPNPIWRCSRPFARKRSRSPTLWLVRLLSPPRWWLPLWRSPKPIPLRWKAYWRC